MDAPTPNTPATPETPESPPPHMPPERFRELGARFLSWATSYSASVAERPVLDAACAPGDVLRALPQHPPEDPGADDEWDRIARDLDELIVPALLHWQHPGFFGYFSCNASEPAVLGALVSSALNVNGMLWATSPAATELETRLLDWCAELFGLPGAFRSDATGAGPHGPTRAGGCIQGTASEATLVALLAARERRRAALRAAGASRRELMTDPVAVVTSDQSHSSVTKAAMIAGVALDPDDRAGVALVGTDATGRMDPDALRATLGRLEAEGITPIMVCPTLGTTGTTAVDDLDAVNAVLDAWSSGDRRRPWVHVDAAFNGCALVCPEHRWMTRGIDRADSLCINPHKWLLTNFDCDLFWTRDTGALTAALSITPEYLRNAATDTGAVIDYRDWQIPLGRSFRALKLWFVLRHYGASGLRAFIREHVAWAHQFETWVRGDERFELVAARTTSLVCFRWRPRGVGDPARIDAMNRALLDELNRSGRLFLSHTTDPAQSPGGAGASVVLRLAIGGRLTRQADVASAWSEIRAGAERVLAGANAASIGA